MDIEKMFTVENLLKVLLAIAIGVMLYKVFFGKETYYNYTDDKSGYAYPMDYEEDIDLVDAVTAPGDVDDMDLVSADSEEDTEVVEEIEDVVDAEDDIYEYADEETEAYDDSEEMMADGTEDAEDDNMYMYEEDVVDEEQDEVVEEVVEDEDQEQTEGQNYDFLYASDVEDGLQENFTLYSNLVGVDTNYSWDSWVLLSLFITVMTFVTLFVINVVIGFKSIFIISLNSIIF